VPGNAERGLPLIQALMIVLDGETGSPLAAMDASVMTAIRTGAASGAATDAMARISARSAAVFGAGVQGRTQLEAVCAVRSIERASVFDMDRRAASDFEVEMADRLGIEVQAASSPREALRGADIVCTATTAKEPVFEDADVEPGAHINAAGAYTPATREIPGATVARARVIVDHLPACMEEAGDILMPMRDGIIERDHIRAELGEVIAGSEPGRGSDEEVTLFKSVGVAVQDAAAAFRAIERARDQGLGSTVRL
jgi:ornithine cyclodeaminase/alanine dehydrogenase-like protein (mu-crystallin family)